MTPVESEAFRFVTALDSAIIAPALTLGGVLLWRRNAWGYIVAVMQGSLYLFVLSINSALEILRGLTEASGELAHCRDVPPADKRGDRLGIAGSASTLAPIRAPTGN